MRVISMSLKITLVFLFVLIFIQNNAYSLKPAKIPEVEPTPFSRANKATLFLVTNQICNYYIDGEKGDQLTPAVPEKRILPLGSYLIKAVAADGRNWMKMIALESPGKQVINILFESPLPGNTEKSQLSFISDIPCTLIMDGATKGRVAPQKPLQIEAGLGSHFIIAINEKGDFWKKYLDITSADPQVFAIWQKGQLHVESDLLCDVYLNNEKQGQISPTTPLYVALAPGKYFLQAITASGESWDQKINLYSAEKQFVKIRMRFIMYDNGTVLDRKTGLMWAARDNGYGITWEKAQNYCNSCRIGEYSDWRMPSLNELIDLYHTNNYGDLIKTTSPLWTSEARTFEACTFYLSSGIAVWHAREDASDIKILPVRRAEFQQKNHGKQTGLLVDQKAGLPQD